MALPCHAIPGRLWIWRRVETIITYIDRHCAKMERFFGSDRFQGRITTCSAAKRRLTILAQTPELRLSRHP